MQVISPIIILSRKMNNCHRSLFQDTHILQGHFWICAPILVEERGRKGESFALFDAQEAIYLHIAQ
jgi:hypothetical protein